MSTYPVGEVIAVRFHELGDHFQRYRLRVPQAVEAMTQSLRRWGQCADRGHLAPGAAAGARRLHPLGGGARGARMTTLLVRLVELDDQRAKAAIYGLNQTGRRPYELEEAWLVQALVREDGLSQSTVAELLGRHKSWVCRRLALLEKLADEVRPGDGSGPLDAHCGTGDRPVARGQPVGSSRAVAARR